MVEYGSTNLINKRSEKKSSLLVLFGITFGEISYLDYEPNTKLKVPQNDLLIFYRQMAVMLKSGVALSQALELLAENMTNNKKLAPTYLTFQKNLGVERCYQRLAIQEYLALS